jgi:hypothetical protein
LKLVHTSHARYIAVRIPENVKSVTFFTFRGDELGGRKLPDGCGIFEAFNEVKKRRARDSKVHGLDKNRRGKAAVVSVFSLCG